MFTSSIAVYGAKPLPMTADAVPQPEDPYGIAKYAVELDLKEAHEMFGLNMSSFVRTMFTVKPRISATVTAMSRHLHEPDHAGPADDNFWRWLADAGVHACLDITPHIADAPTTPGARGEIFNIGADQPYTGSMSSRNCSPGHGGAVPPDHPPCGTCNEVAVAFPDHSKAQSVFAAAADNAAHRGNRPHGPVGTEYLVHDRWSPSQRSKS